MKRAYRKPSAAVLLNRFFMRTHRNTPRELEDDLRRQGWKKWGPIWVPDNKRRSKP